MEKVEIYKKGESLMTDSTRLAALGQTLTPNDRAASDSTRLATYDGRIERDALVDAAESALAEHTRGARGPDDPANRAWWREGFISGRRDLRERITELEETLAEALDYVPDYFREKWKLDDPLKRGANDA